MTKITNWFSHELTDLNVAGVTPEQWCHLFLNYFIPTPNNPYRHVVLVCHDNETAEFIFELCKHQHPFYHTMFFPGLEVSPYGNILPSYANLLQRFSVLHTLTTSDNPTILVCTAESLTLKIPCKKFFIENNHPLNREDIISPRDLSSLLVSLGYFSSATVEEPGTFASKGEIFDIFPISGQPYRLTYFDNMVENIFLIDKETNKTKKNCEITSLNIGPSPAIVASRPYLENFRSKVPIPGPQFKEKFEKRKAIINNLSDGILFNEFPCFLPMFFQELSSITDYFSPSNTVFICLENDKIITSFTDLIEQYTQEYDKHKDNKESDLLLGDPDNIYKLNKPFNFKKITTNTININIDLDKKLGAILDILLEKTETWIARNVGKNLHKTAFIKEFFSFLKNEFQVNGTVIFTYSSESTKKEIAYLLDLYEFPESIYSRISFKQSNLQNGYFYPPEKILTIAEGDLFTRKQSKTYKDYHNVVDLFAERLSSIKPGDFVIHNSHGLGKYLGLESITINDIKTDYLIIEYAEKDKIYVPIYKINLIQKHADSTAALNPANLRTNKFTQAKKRAKESASRLAFDLLELQAERQTNPAFAFSPPDHAYKEFELEFPFIETYDQRKAIDSILESMQKPAPMDHLVCGDVGFGKTEIAMRAAFKAISDNKQVAVLVPTTILALQHYQSFIERFKKFPVNIEYISRFKNPQEVLEIINKLKMGQIDIIIGTHKLLNDSIEFKSLGLVIIDEEHKFGVKHKEKLKIYKSTTDFMTLTATPIPRTLQLAFLGLRDLSLIQTPPPKRQSIKTYIIKQDDLTIQSAIKKEISRGGQVFFVHNRVMDIEKIHHYLKELVPEASIVIGHGQLPESQLEKRITDFYMGKYQILLCTTIIESGLDIPNANTMIINRADRFGLAQLHQLRGRIGRSDKKAYAYFVIPNDRNLNIDAENRLKALQTYADMGSGFSLASCDLEFRGAGDILGAEQSGHIESIGLELYMELLQEAINEIKGKQKIIKKDIEIVIPYNAYIPNNYITDPSSRLKYYKKLSNCYDMEKLTNLAEEIEDIFGLLPHELGNLIIIIKTRILLQNMAIKSIQVAGNQISMNFDANFLSLNLILRDKIVDYFLSHKKQFQLTPTYQVFYVHKSAVTPEVMLEFVGQLLENIKIDNG
ncbi:MAG: transcription-repair coupling factor [Bdellovibrionales bacterium RIFOXYB1_FULL_37_110]|nr:MAG: transcription-repair coupling factor [Bdellovibrionales bacterium RIFOXYA1_FULL_38_20]OFZ50350.1 MAG: transcription-repair coupling factor [Bdellovibrionales bacterium RIFOXYC1_FULL_37_79]OFZ60959.1 MAG: transcription-repair coupling factor [Bdellovibrionales bacterium RIFOXYB1_FULL_37_110]